MCVEVHSALLVFDTSSFIFPCSFVCNMAAPPAKKLRGKGKAKVGVQLSPEEFEYVDTSAKGRRFWVCKKCSGVQGAAGGNTGIKDTFPKRGADEHLELHGITKDKYKDWVLFKDQGRIKRQTDELCELEFAIGVTVHSDDSDEGDQDAAGEAAAVTGYAHGGVTPAAVTVHGLQWVAHQVWAKCLNDGTPVLPLEYGGIATHQWPQLQAVHLDMLQVVLIQVVWLQLMQAYLFVLLQLVLPLHHK